MFSYIGFLTVGYLHRGKCKNSENLERSLESLISNSKNIKFEQVSIVILLEDCSSVDKSKFLRRIDFKFKSLVRQKVLKVVKTPEEFYINTSDRSQYWEKLTSYSSEYIRKSKAIIRNMAYLWKFSTTQSHYFIQFTDHVIVEGNIVLALMRYAKNWSNNLWLWAENLKGVLTGRVYNTKDLPELIEVVDLLGSHLPVDYILTYYRHFRYSRQVLKIPQSLISVNYTFIADNPSAVVTTSLLFGGGKVLQDIYENRKGYFWALAPKQGDFILIDFKDPTWISRILIETGAHLYEDIIPAASLSVVFEDESENTNFKAGCYKSNYTKIADFTGSVLDIEGFIISSAKASCIKVLISPIISEEFQFWTIIRTIAVFQ